MTVERLTEQSVQTTTWRANCAGCGGWVATVYGGWATESRCFNWRVSRDLAPDRKCPMYGKPQRIRKP